MQLEAPVPSPDSDDTDEQTEKSAPEGDAPDTKAIVQYGIPMNTIRLETRSQRLVRNAHGFNDWEHEIDELHLPAERTALVICDMWDRNWSRAANARVAELAPRVDALYNPAMPPYVSHEEGTALVVGYIEKFWCPTAANVRVSAGERPLRAGAERSNRA